ncbi:DNA cytosine methyltransferase [Collimonas fungivorans]|uniref:DNA (cytosine-5-)-methyltransferase n=1 Tax=Collimonas fungivorans (strain Ter331) TaxID=1005048 RepID=G0AAI8_COLFT|nr:DNA cytosine methyltransferase [Collimonas fungivorans]AEK63202.1 Site-specific DNA methylase [Collimonas fungivorans Ter331]
MKRDAFTLSLDLGHELVVDNFAGGGGASTALAIALGREPDIAINHDGEALCMHAANHPTTEHHTEDVFMIHPGFVTKQRPIGAAWFSPTCTHFSKAKGGNLLNQKVRGLAWVTVKWGALQMPRMMFLENVEEFLGWGPLDAHGSPIKELKGRTFEAFVQVLTTGIAHDHPDLAEIHDTLGADFPIERLHIGLGYKVEWRVLKACDFGAPTIRKRLFMVMRRDDRPIVWPVPTHAPRDSEAVKSGRLLPYLSAASCIDWSIPCPSIFGRKKDLKPATLRRVGKGFERYTKDAANPYIVGQGGPAYAGKPTSTDAPFGTLTTENHRAIVIPSIVPMTHHGSDRTGSIDEPLATVTCANRGELALAAVSMVQIGYGEAPGQAPRVMDLESPLGTVVAGGGKHAIVAAHITKFNTGSVGHAADEPLATVTSGGGAARPAGAAHGLGIVAASLVQYYSNGSQNRSIQDPMPAIVTKDRIGVTCAYLAKHYKGVVGASVEQPMPTVTTSDHSSLITAHLVGIDNQRNGDRDTWPVENPLGTIVTENRHALVTSNMIKLRGDNVGSANRDPLGTITAGGQHHAEVRATLVPVGAYEEKRHAIREFLWEYCPSLKDVERPELLMIQGVMMEVVDIGLRMLKPRELANAQGFPADYILDPLYTKVNKRGKTVTKPLSGSAQVRMIGNSVSPPPAVALIRANCTHEQAIARAA